MPRFALALAIVLPIVSHAQLQEVRIGLLRDLVVRNAIVVIGPGGAALEIDGHKVADLKANDGLRIERTASGLVARSLSSSWEATDRLLVIPRGKGGGFSLRSLDHKMADRTYPGWLQVRTGVGRLVLVVQAPLEEYVAGVVRSEAGKDQHIEYYKVQAVICRTYALANLRKHLADGYQLCDGTHCQVFHGRAEYEPILAAARATHGMVLVDADIRLIHATFHSNCGGETMNAEDVWSKPEPYLCATSDSACLRSPHARWQKILGRNEWLGYLQRKYGVDTNDARVVDAVTRHAPDCRELYLAGITPLIPIEEVRDDWRLNSAYFEISAMGDQVIFTGRGFGHGVGLCQEGAMQMARNGADFTTVLHHYYNGVHLVDLSNLDFFRDDGR